MASAKHQYTILFNDYTEGGIKHNYNYGSTKDIELFIGENKAAISFSQTRLLTAEDLTSFKNQLFRDAYRKIYLLHAIERDEGLTIHNIRIKIDANEYLFDESTPNFPFLFTMIKEGQQDLDPSWKDTMDDILHTTKSCKDTDLRFCAMFSYLAAKSRDYRIDRFTNLWTAMNAYGNFIAKSYEKKLTDCYDHESLSNKDKRKYNDYMPLYKKDMKIVKVLAHLIKTSLPDSSFAREHDRSDFYQVEKELLKIDISDYPELYQEAYKALDDKYTLPEKYAELEKSIAAFGTPLFLFLLLEYPYQLRCNYLHGSFTTILFSTYNGYELASLGVVNYFLESYLNCKIPGLFVEDFEDEEHFSAIVRAMREAVGKDNTGAYKFDSIYHKLKRR